MAIERKQVLNNSNEYDVYDGRLGGFRSGNSGGDGTYDLGVWNYLYNLIKPISVIDVGCGEGHALHYFKSLGVEELLGIDGTRSVLEFSPVPEHILIVDFYKGQFIPNNNFDLCWSCEFLEHVDEQYIKNYFSIFLKSKYVTITHAVVGQGGHHHVNCKNEDYWISYFKENNFIYMERESHEVKNIATAKYIKNTVKIFKNLRY
jgi:SAM-dependent methyltransferase